MEMFNKDLVPTLIMSNEESDADNDIVQPKNRESKRKHSKRKNWLGIREFEREKKSFSIKSAFKWSEHARKNISTTCEGPGP